MRYLRHDSGEAVSVTNRQALGDESPLEFDEDGRAGPLSDDVAETVAAMDAHITLGKRVPRDRDSNAGTDVGFDAGGFVDRTPMDDIVEDIESGDYDAHLDAIAAAEGEGRDREGVADAVDKRRE